MNHFQLHPFPTTDPLPAIEITGTIARQRQILTIEYRLQGDLAAIAIPPLAVAPSRQDRLWEATCCELFLGIPGECRYWEFNFAPTGNWQIYQLEDYRQGLRPELAVADLPLTIELQPQLCSLALAFDLSKIIAIDRSIEVAVTAVIQPHQGEISYWALTHTGSVADFHRRDSFALRLDV